MANYDLDYALSRLRDAIDYAETDGDFTPARKWVNEVEKSAKEEKEESEYLDRKAVKELDDATNALAAHYDTIKADMDEKLQAVEKEPYEDESQLSDEYLSSRPTVAPDLRSILIG